MSYSNGFQTLFFSPSSSSSSSFSSSFFVFSLLRAMPLAYGGSQARGRIGAVATTSAGSFNSLCQGLNLHPGAAEMPQMLLYHSWNSGFQTLTIPHSRIYILRYSHPTHTYVYMCILIYKETSLYIEEYYP